MGISCRGRPTVTSCANAITKRTLRMPECPTCNLGRVVLSKAYTAIYCKLDSPHDSVLRFQLTLDSKDHCIKNWQGNASHGNWKSHITLLTFNRY